MHKVVSLLKLHDVSSYGGAAVKLQAFLTMMLSRGKLSASRSGRLDLLESLLYLQDRKLRVGSAAHAKSRFCVEV